ncbi:MULTISPECIES: HAMP domain-containing histidine kinase [unclassified Enterococcus]|uniref:HAMP domain-containing histidine kinase n=1 Tax=unclassified Enterococcus TaxID=2608891 RepID=UPI0015539D86|nr:MULTISPECIES: HAMP domain-containing histidine kinase [unclassified Enterococcus]MBS7578224.1 HAMP domain-containing histidine kinase [Enterococcus sp. MMGLQ5-2]MBS7585400.1 HAMP domain-containing histidine kinase [Enterococcus sp. MMGLQ5-1]NPD13257.1 HAMP domain-containing histidine kinase [Enterococcus sp. MMGLQ5-1]NPD38055.1 HAMP domain-containing histidine kinase [Enterococcus sp. MMGLQ5-2]
MMKWALASALFIFILFTTFVVITYNSAVNLIMSREQQNLERTVSDINRKFAASDEELTTTFVQESLNQSLPFSKGVNSASYLKKNEFLAEIIQKSFSFYIYDAKKQIIFGTDDLPPSLIDDKKISPTVISLGKEIGSITAQPIISKDTGLVVGYVQGVLIPESFSEIREHIFNILIIIEIIVLLLSIVLGYFLARYFLRPVQILRNTMQALKDDPKQEISMDSINTGDELEDLANIFAELMAKIKESIEQKDQFISDVSHELRTPVAIVEGHLKLLDRWGKNDPEVLDESIQSSIQSIQRMKHLIQEMLELSRTGHIATHPEELTEVCEVVNRVAHDFKVLYDSDFKINLTNQLNFSDVALINEERLEQVLIILLDNAIKYSTTVKLIEIEAWSEVRCIYVKIKDYGEGISKDDLEKIFDRFYRVDKVRTNSKGGNGLGLSIAHQIISSYHGMIKVNSKENEGSEFIIVLPKVVE